MNQRILNYLGLSKILFLGLIISQITTFCFIGHLVAEKQEAKLNNRICMEELIPLEPIPMEKLR